MVSPGFTVILGMSSGFFINRFVYRLNIVPVAGWFHILKKHGKSRLHKVEIGGKRGFLEGLSGKVLDMCGRVK